MLVRRVIRFTRRKLWWITSRWFERKGYVFAKNFPTVMDQSEPVQELQNARLPNRLTEYFESNTEGPGIWKWLHYFDLYDRHLNKFVGRKSINIVEIGVYSGGSMNMWREYFGDGCNVYGIDIEPACKNYENDYVKIFIGDQEDRSFWRKFKREVGPVDIIIDDGGHTFGQQIVTLEEMLPSLRAGGVYVCEDVHGVKNEFLPYVHGLARNLNDMLAADADPGEETVANSSAFQAQVHSIHQYPFSIVIEKNSHDVRRFYSSKNGTSWQPFFD